MVLAIGLIHIAGAHAPPQVDEVDVDVMAGQLLRYGGIHSVHDGVALGVHVAKGAAEEHLYVFSKGPLGHKRFRFGVW